MSNRKAPAVPECGPVFTKEQLIGAKTFDYPRDAVAAVLKDGERYMRDQAGRLVSDFLERKVK